jgi:lipoprotein-releasing system permease protein
VPFEVFVALRFLREGRTQTALILGGATVGVAVIVFITALISGLQSTLVDKTLSSQPHITLKRPERLARVLPPAGAEVVSAVVEKAPERTRSIEQWQRVLALVRGTPGLVAAAPTAAGSAFASRAEVSKSVALRGIEEESFDAVIRIRRKMTAGSFRVQGTEVVIGVVLAEDLGLSVGDKLRLTTAEGRGDVFTVSGIFDFGDQNVNERWVLVSLRSAQTLLDLEAGITTIEAKAADPFRASLIAAEIGPRSGLDAESWMQVNAQLLTALASQSASALMIQSFVVIAVALGIASVLGVSVIQKSRQIGILKATGTSTGTVLRVFLVEGALVGVAGSAAGCLLGAAMSYAFAALVRNPYGESLFPIELGPGLFLLASGVAVATSLLAAVAPALHAARLDPAVVIRHG